MTDPNVNALWGRVILEELARTGIESVCVAPGSRSTPLAVAAASHAELTVFSILEERSAGFFALGRAKRSGRPTPLICTSGTAPAEFHPAVIEADRARIPMLVLTADRPPELHDSGANQTVDQQRLYGDAVRWFRSLPEPAVADRTLRSLRTTVDRAVQYTAGPPSGPVHLNVPFAKPLAPTGGGGPVPSDFAEANPLAVTGRNGPYVEAHTGTTTLDATTIETVATAIEATERGIIVAGPTDLEGPSPEAVSGLARVTGYPVLADPLSTMRFGPHVESTPVCGGFDAYLDTPISDRWPAPEVVLRFGASPTSKPLRQYLASTGARQFVIDPGGGWREAAFMASDLIVADPTETAEALVESLAESAESPRPTAWCERFLRAESAHWELVSASDAWFEGGVVSRSVELAPSPATVVVSNSMPVRDLDRFGRPVPRQLTCLGNRGASGIDGVTSTAIGAASATDDPLMLVIGDLAFYHDLPGLLALERAGVEATIVVVNNDGGGIFNALPIADYDATVYRDLFETPHGLTFESVATFYGLDYDAVSSYGDLTEAVESALGSDGSNLIEVRTKAAESFAVRDRLQTALIERVT